MHGLVAVPCTADASVHAHTLAQLSFVFPGFVQKPAWACWPSLAAWSTRFMDTTTTITTPLHFGGGKTQEGMMAMMGGE
jgi:hypothetical protein